jgi:hypothetical protein
MKEKKSLRDSHPELALEADGWDPTEVISGTSKKLKWRCSKNHTWEVSARSRVHGQTGCPFCSNNLVVSGENDLLALNPALAAEEVRRCAAKGSYAIAFSENVAKLGQPSLYTGAWDVLWEACQETDTSVSMHIGSSSSMPTTSDDAPLATSMSMYAQNAQGSLCDWVFSGSLERFPDITIAYAESQVGWMPFQLERMDAVWRDGRGDVDNVKTLPSEQVKAHAHGWPFRRMLPQPSYQT